MDLLLQIGRTAGLPRQETEMQRPAVHMLNGPGLLAETQSE